MPQLTDEQKKQYNSYRAAGMPPERALSIATQDSDNSYNPAITEGVDNILFGSRSLASGILGGAKEALTGGIKDVYDDSKKYGVLPALVKSPLSLAAGAGRGVGMAVSSVFETADDLTGETVSQTINPAIESALQSEFAQTIGAGFNEINDATMGIPSDILDSLNLLGLGAVVKGGTANAIKGQILNRSKSMLETGVKAGDTVAATKTGLADFFKAPVQNTIDAGTSVVKGATEIIKSPIEKTRLSLSDIDPQVETALKNSSFDDVNRHFQTAKNAVKDPSKLTPLELVGQKAEEAYNINKVSLTKASEAKKKILEANGDKLITKEKLDEIKSDTFKQVAERFGVDATDFTDIKQIEGRFSTLDAPDQALLVDYFTKLNSLGDTPTLREIDGFVDWAQGQLYKQSASLSKLETANDAIVAELKQVTGKINGSLKETAGNGYGEVNARIKNLLELQDELNRGLGADARKGGGFVKRLFSPTSGNTKEIFAQIKKETGIDLFKEATLAKFAMENVGDVRQRSLLKALDISIKDISQVDLAKPGTIMTFFREKADLDGQELANAFLRELKKGKQKNEQVKE